MLVLQGMAWERADWLGHSLVARARIAAGIRQPAGYDSDYDLSSWVEFHTCVICERPFTPRQMDHECCSRRCRQRKHRIARSAVALTRCEQCREPFEAEHGNQKYCSRRCMRRARADRVLHDRRIERLGQCKHCGRDIPITERIDRLYCSDQCRTEYQIAKMSEVHRVRRVAQDLATPRYCANPDCGAPLPVGMNSNRRYCSWKCKYTVTNRRAYLKAKSNGHAAANGHDHAMDSRPGADRPAPAGGGLRSPADPRPD
jgi:hypothetical protein